MSFDLPSGRSDSTAGVRDRPPVAPALRDHPRSRALRGGGSGQAAATGAPPSNRDLPAPCAHTPRESQQELGRVSRRALGHERPTTALPWKPYAVDGSDVSGGWKF